MQVDDDDVRQLLSRFLERRGHSVESRPGALGLPSRVGDWWRGAEAPDAIVLDMMMPAMSGDAALKLLARNERSRAIPVVLYSAVERSEGERIAAEYSATLSSLFTPWEQTRQGFGGRCSASGRRAASIRRRSSLIFLIFL